MILGRDTELKVVGDFLVAASDGPRSLMLEGVAGIGKTAIWAEAVDAAHRMGHRVLSCRCTGTEATWAYSAMGDLFASVSSDVVASLPEVQRVAWSVALLDGPAKDPSPGDRVVAAAVLGVMRQLAASGPVVIAIDDVQWLDTASRNVLTSALRRLQTEPVRLVATVRVTHLQSAPRDVHLGFPDDRRINIPVGPVSVGMLQRILRDRVDLQVSRPTLTRLHEATGGNPFNALEMARALERRGHELTPDEPLPVPSDLRLLVNERLDGLSAEARDLLLLTSVLSRPTQDLLARGVDQPDRALDEIRLADLIWFDGERLRFTHPLVASIPYADLPPSARRQLHRRASQVVADPEERARHLALGSDGTNAAVADALDAAARYAAARGSPFAAAELAELALLRTPLDHPDEMRRRRFTVAEQLFQHGDPARARVIAVEGIDAGPPGPDRMAGILLLARIDYWIDGSPAAAAWCEQAMVEAGEDQLLQARCHAALADIAPYGAERDFAHATAAVDVLVADGEPDPGLLANALKNVAFHGLRLGRGLRVDVLEQAAELEAKAPRVAVMDRVGAYFGMFFKVVDRFDESRRWLEDMRSCAIEEGDDSSLPVILGHLTLLECWSGDYELASTYGLEGLEIAKETGIDAALLGASHSLVLAHRGDLDAARSMAAKGLALNLARGHLAGVAVNRRTLGFVELSAGDAPAAVEHLLGAVAIADELAIGEPSYLRVHADAVEALLSVGRVEDAERLTAELAPGRPIARTAWATSMEARCRGLVLAAHGDQGGAIDALDEAVVAHQHLQMPFELARTLLILGSMQRRARRRSDARRTGEGARDMFLGLGAPLWADRAAAELARLGGRVTEQVELTSTERRVAQLVGAGRTNREVAEELFLSVRTVESHLSRVYRKLGVRSRTELARAV